MGHYTTKEKRVAVELHMRGRDHSYIRAYVAGMGGKQCQRGYDPYPWKQGRERGGWLVAAA